MKYEIVDSVEGQRELKPALQRLFLDCFGKELNDGEWAYFYASSPERVATSITAWADGELVGHYAAVPYSAIDGNGRRCLLLARGMTLAIAERGRAQGVLRELLERIKPALTAKGMSSTVGFPNELSWRPLVFFCGWRILHESPMRIVNVATGENGLVTRRATSPPGTDLAPPYEDTPFMSWRDPNHVFQQFVVDETTAVVAKVMDGDILDVMDAWTFDGAVHEDSLPRLARHLGLSRICITDWHARSVGFDSSGGEPTGYTVRMGAMSNDGQPVPPLRFSLLFSDVYM